MSTAPFAGIERGLWPSKKSETSQTELREPARDDNELHYVFLEGSTGVGKSTLTAKLQKMGYHVHFEGFVELCREFPQYHPTSTLMTLKWTQRLLTAMEEGKRLHAQGKIKDGVMFFDRSFLTPAVYARGQPVEGMMRQAMKDARQVYLISLVLCEADNYAVDLRIAGRIFDAPPPIKTIREALGEADASYQALVRTRYKELEEEGVFDALVDTSSSKLALAALLHALNIPFALPAGAQPP